MRVLAAALTTLLVLSPTLADAYHGLPTAAVTCSGSPLHVGEEIPGKDGKSQNIMDINTLWSDGRVEGWIYRATDAKTYVMLNANIRPRRSYSVGSGTTRKSFGNSGDSLTIFPWSDSLPDGMHAVKCFSRGTQLRPR